MKRLKMHSKVVFARKSNFCHFPLTFVNNNKVLGLFSFQNHLPVMKVSARVVRAAEPVQPILMVFRRMLLLLSSIKGVLKDGGQESARGFIKFSPCYVTTDEKSNLDVGANNNKDAAADDFFFLKRK